MHKESKSLIQLCRKLLDLENTLIEQDGELTVDIESQLELTEFNLAEKLDNYVYLFSRLDATEDWAKNQIDQFKYVLKRVERARERLNYRLQYAMAVLNKTSLEGDKYVFEQKESRGKVVVDDIDKIPFEYKKIVTDWVPDKVAIQESFKAGVEIPGARIEKQKVIKSKVKV